MLRSSGSLTLPVFYYRRECEKAQAFIGIIAELFEAVLATNIPLLQ